MSEAAQHVLRVAARAGRRVYVHAKGDPAVMIAYGIAAGLTVAAVTVGYGGYFYGQKLIGWFRDVDE